MTTLHTMQCGKIDYVHRQFHAYGLISSARGFAVAPESRGGGICPNGHDE
jgi:hypothetical protein